MAALQQSLELTAQKRIPSFQGQRTTEHRQHKQTGITEVVLPATPNQEYAFVLPMLAHLSRQNQDRWFTWIAPRGIKREHLQEFGFSLNNVRLIHTQSDEQTLWVLWEALALGNSATVVASYENLSKEELRNLETAAHQGQCQALLLRHRQESW